MIDAILKKTMAVINWQDVSLALLALSPLFFGYLLWGNLIVLNMGLLTMSLFIVMIRLQLNSLQILFHYIIILAGFSALYFSLSYPALFVLLCALMAFATVYLTKHGINLRTLANYSFIPSVYLACEMRVNIENSIYNKYVEFVMISFVSLISVLMLQLILRLFRPKKITRADSFWKNIIFNLEPGEPALSWIQPAFAIFVGVFIAASIVVFFNIQRGEWVIWSTASVITADFASSKVKLRERLMGASLGIFLGLISAQFLPKTLFIYSLFIIGVMLTLIAFKKYFVGFTSRCFCIAVAASAISASTPVAIERVSHVFLGGMIGILAAFISYQLIKK